MENGELIRALRRISMPDKHRCFGCGYENNCQLHGCVIIRAAIAELKHADVPAQRGYWIENQPYTIKHKNVTMSGNAPQCSECGYISFGGFENKTRYCPNCGAKMDKEV